MMSDRNDASEERVQYHFDGWPKYAMLTNGEHGDRLAQTSKVGRSSVLDTEVGNNVGPKGDEQCG